MGIILPLMPLHLTSKSPKNIRCPKRSERVQDSLSINFIPLYRPPDWGSLIMSLHSLSSFNQVTKIIHECMAFFNFSPSCSSSLLPFEALWPFCCSLSHSILCRGCFPLNFIYIITSWWGLCLEGKWELIITNFHQLWTLHL